MSCSIFTKPILQDVKNLDRATINIQWLKNLIPPFDAEISGIWRPIWITKNNSNSQYVTPLFPARSNASSSFSLCNCSDSQINPDLLYQDGDNPLGLCSYCIDPATVGVTNPPKWRLHDSEGNSSPRDYPVSCCNGGCDTMMKQDDYIPKIPYLNHAYITGAVDSKHHREFPICSNPALGCDNFIRTSDLATIKGAELRVDWRIQETISEIPYDPFTSQHNSEHLHNMAYQKSKITSATCGNFIMLSLPDNATPGNFYSTTYSGLRNLIGSKIQGESPDTSLPSIEAFKNVPYGFDRETYKNIFVHDDKVASYWKWNYSSGILCWYRYYDAENSKVIDANIRTIKARNEYDQAVRELENYRSSNLNMPDYEQQLIEQLQITTNNKNEKESIESKLRQEARLQDQRPIPGVDLYIAPGDVFFAKNDGPEPLGDLNNPFGRRNGLIHSCPSGLKVVKGQDVSMIIPSGSNFLYVSANLYDRFYNLYNRLLSIGIQNTQNSSESPHERMLMSAAILATAPQYDEITVDLLKRTNDINDYKINIYSQLDELNKDMLRGTKYDSVSRLNYISNKTELLDTLCEKYGAYLWIPPGSTQQVAFADSTDNNFALSLNFDLSFSKNDIKWRNSTCFPIESCSDRSFFKDFSYDQRIGYSLTSVSTTTNETLRHAVDCDETNGNDEPYNYGLYSNIYINNSLIRSKFTSNGCYTFSGIYPRISQSSDTNFCRDCDQYSSFYLISGADFAECYNHIGDASFCYDTLARRFDGKPNITVSRRRRRLADGTKRLVRSYRATFWNPYLDSVAFHPDNGAFINSYPFALDKYVAFERNTTSSISANNIYVSFSTRDVGIKIYDLQAEYIQSRKDSSAGCRRFPVNEKCKCLPMVSPDTIERPVNCANPNISTARSSNVFTPSLSTRYSIRLKKYGGYSQDYLDKIFGQGVISAGGTVPVLNSYVSPLTPLKCDSTDSIDLYNYTNSIWDLKLLNRDRDAHTYVSVSDDIDLTGPRFFYVLDRGDYDGDVLDVSTRLNPRSRRYTSKITIGDSVLYSNKTVKLDLAGQNVRVRIQNPFLEKAITSAGGNEDMILFPPSGKLLAEHMFSERGDQVSKIRINFHQYFNKTKLLFNIPPVRPMGRLKKADFNPNSGLRDYESNFTPIKDGVIFYQNELFSTNQLPSGSVYYAKLDEQVSQALYALDDFSIHKKLRLYIKQNNKWHYYIGNNIGAFASNGVKYPGSPTIYEYSTINKSKNLPALLAVPAKTHIDLNFINNKIRPVLSKKDAEFPYIFNDIKSYKAESFDIEMPGLRHYFMVPEIDSATSIPIDEIKNITNFRPSAPLDYGDAVMLQDGTRWICIDPEQPNKQTSYIYSPFGYFNHYYSDLHLNFTSINSNGYVYNSKKKCNYPVTITTLDNRTFSNTIVEKSVYIKFYTKTGTLTSINNLQENTYIQAYTVFKLANTIPDNFYLIDIFQNTNYFTVGQINSPQAEYSSLLKNKFLPGKWGDVINYDGEIADSLVSSRYDLKKIFPKSEYNNIFYKAIVNNYSEKYTYRIKLHDQENYQTLNIPDKQALAYYCILNPYALGDERSYNIDVTKYQNFVPLMDLNVLNLSGVQPLDLQPSGSGIINISNITKNIEPSGEYLPYRGQNGEDVYFWLTTSDQDRLRQTFVPVDNFYSETLRLDHSIYWLSRINQGSSRYENDGLPFTRLFNPRSARTDIPEDRKIVPGSSFSFVEEFRNIPYWRHPIYGDRDDGTCANSGCNNIDLSQGIAIAGDYFLRASYTIANDSVGPPLQGSSLEFILGYDAGLYNTVNNALVTIERFEIDPNNLIDRPLDDCSSDRIFPTNYTINSMSPIFQNTINDNSISIPKKYSVDDVANEMLFRIMHGESQSINKKMYFIDNTVYNRSDLVGYSDPKISAEDIYSQILYSYDRNASNAVKIDGSFSIFGVLQLGTSTSININNNVINLSIIKINTNFYIRCVGPGFNENILLHEEMREGYSYITQIIRDGEEAGPAPEPTSENETITYLGDVVATSNYSHSVLAIDGYEGSIENTLNAINTGSSRILKSEVKNIDWTNSYGFGSINFGSSFQCGNIGAPGSWISSRQNIPASSTEFNYRQYVCGQPTTGRVFFSRATFETPRFCIDRPYPWYLNTGNCGPFELGYCRKANCDYCEETFRGKTEINFQYNWELCRTRFTTYGHIYREQHAFDLTPIYVPPNPGESCVSLDRCGSEFSCSPLSFPLYGGSREETEKWYKENAWTGSLEADPCGGQCCLPVIGEVDECTPATKGVAFCCGATNPCCYGFVSEGCDTMGEGCWSGTMFQDPETPGLGVPGDRCEDYRQACGVIRNGARVLTTYRIFSRIWREPRPYNPLCPTALCTVSYSNSLVTLSVAGKQLCFDVSINRCPTININSTMDKFSVNDSISSSCDECLESAIKIELEPQQMNFVTKTETRKCILGTMKVCNANPNGLVGAWVYIINPGGGLPGDTGGPGASAGYMTKCGGGPPDYVCGKIGKLLYSSDDPTYPITYECLQPADCEIPSVLEEYELEARKYYYTLLLSNNNLRPGANVPGVYYGAGAAHIPLSEFIEGVVPGSVSDLITETYTGAGEKVTRLGSIIGNISTVYVFSYTYQYIRPVTIQDILRNDSDIVCTLGSQIDPSDIKEVVNKGGISCQVLKFPNAYSFNYGSPNWFNYHGGNPGSVSYTVINPIYEKTTCSTNVSCYYNHKVFICGQSALACDYANDLVRDEGAIPNKDTIQGKVPCYDQQWKRIPFSVYE